MKTKYLHSLFVMILMFWVLMMVTNASEIIEIIDEEPEVTNANEIIEISDEEPDSTNATEKEEKVHDISFKPILKSEFQMNRRIYLWAIKHKHKYPQPLTKMILEYLEPTPVRTKLQDLNPDKVAVSRDGNLLLALGYGIGSTLSLLDLTTGTKVRTFATPNLHEIDDLYVCTAVCSCAIADSHAFVACGTANGNIYIWNTMSSELMTTLVGHTYIVHECCIFSNDTRIASTSMDRTIRVWNIETDSYSCMYELALDKCVHGLLISAKHARIFAPIPADEMIKVWNVNNGERLPDIGNYKKHFCNSCVLSDDDDNPCIGYANKQGTITIWNFMTNEYTNTISIAPKVGYNIEYLSSKRLVWYIWDEKLGLYDIETDTEVILSVKVKHVTISANNKYLIFTHSDENTEENTEELFLEVYWLETGKSKGLVY